MGPMVTLPPLITTVHPQLSESQLSDIPIIQTPKVTVLLEYFSIGVCSIRVNDCSISVFGQSPIYKSMGFSYPNKFTDLNTFLKSFEQRCSDNRGCIVS